MPSSRTTSRQIYTRYRQFYADTDNCKRNFTLNKNLVLKSKNLDGLYFNTNLIYNAQNNEILQQEIHLLKWFLEGLLMYDYCYVW